MSVIELEVGGQKITSRHCDLLRATSEIEDRVIKGKNGRERVHCLPLKVGAEENVGSRSARQHLSRKRRVQRGFGNAQIGSPCLCVFPGHSRLWIVLLSDIYQFRECV